METLVLILLIVVFIGLILKGVFMCKQLKEEKQEGVRRIEKEIEACMKVAENLRKTMRK